jgi:hypothetical protein
MNEITSSISSGLLECKDLMEAVSFIVTIIMLPFALVVFFVEQQKERDNEEEEQYQHLSDAYNEFLKVVIANSDLHLRSKPALLDATEDQQERMKIIFDMLTSLFERAFLVAYKDNMNSAERRRWNSWDNYMRDWCSRDDFYNSLDDLLRGEDPEFTKHIKDVARQERSRIKT